MGHATAVLSPGQPVTLPPAAGISFEIEAGQKLKLAQPEGEQVADLISFNRDDMRELLSMLSSRAVNLCWKLTAPHVLYSNCTRPMWQIEEDLTGRELLRRRLLQRKSQHDALWRHRQGRSNLSVQP